ncbi:class I SAM-dependent methyltransferase [Robiginitalea sp. IMCC44478]|uniref:class I SAM-dependent methyltransferase n=1 Tax=Robiginitalea sp. IMCC44478 TaxID=3459122 RepID=UPI004042881D
MTKESLQIKDHLVSGESFRLKPHPETGVLQTQPVPKDLETYYQSSDYISHSDNPSGLMGFLYKIVKGQNLRRKIRLINKLAGSKGKLLDIGSGTGSFLESAQMDGWTVFGVEPNKAARNLSQKKKLSIVSDIENLSEVKFEVITLWHVLEHVPDLEKYIRFFKERLQAEGVLILALPNHNSFDAKYYKENWAAYDVPRHLWHFSKDSVEKVFEPMGFVMEQIIPMWFDAFYVSWLSEKYRGNRLAPLFAFFLGLLSNLSGLGSKEYSSHIYILKKASKAK